MNSSTNRRYPRTQNAPIRFSKRKFRNAQGDSNDRSSALLVGTVRDGGRGFSRNLQKLIRVVETRFDVTVFIVESDSSDSTLEQLARLTERNPRVTFISLGQMVKVLPERLERIAHCRNAYLDFLEEAGDSFEFVLIADLDGVNSRLGIRQLAELNLDGDWAGCFANQVGPYYDIGALRAKFWQDNDPFESRQRLVQIGFHFEQAHHIAVTSKMITLSTNAPPIEVDSAFGGFAVYRTKWLRGARYSAHGEGGASLQVEHVAFNQSIREKGGRLFILPGMTNARFTEHTSNFRWISRFAFWVMSPFVPIIKRALGGERSDAAGRLLRNLFRS